MADRGINLSPIKWFGLVITIIALTNITILWDIPVLRQIFGFIFLTFIPGFLILLILKLNRLGLLEKIVLSVGLSVAFLMLFGLALNSSLLAVGYTRPLSTVPLLISFSTATIVLAIIAYIRNKGITFSFPSLKPTTREKMLLIVPSLFPLLSVVGMRIMNLTDNNVLLMVLLFVIPVFVILISFYQSEVPQRLYPSLILLISISLILILSLRSNHIIGADTHDEYYLFQATLDNLHWSVLGPNILDACLSISLLPAIYQLFLDIIPEYIFKIIYSFLFSVSPLVVYIIAKKYIGNCHAFLASFFFTSQVIFLWTVANARANIAVLFFALAIMVLFHDGIGGVTKRLLFIIFSTSCVISHYSTAYIFFFILLFTWIGMQIIPMILSRKRKAAAPSENPVTGDAPSNSLPRGVMPKSDVNTSQSQPKRGITVNIVALFFVLLFFWYSQITAAAFRVGVGLIRHTLANLNEWFLIEAKGATGMAAAGKEIYTLPQDIRFVVSWLTIAFIAIGVLATVARYKRMVAMPNSRHTRPNFLCSKFETEYLVLSLACSAILVFAVVLTSISRSYSTENTFFQMMTVLSMFFIIGGIMVAKWLRARPLWIILPVLIPFFMCTTGTMYQIFNVPASMALNSVGTEYERAFIHDEDSYAAKWLKEYGKEEIKIYTGPWRGTRMLVSQSKIPHSRIRDSFIPWYEEGKKIDGYVYLRRPDTEVQKVVTEYPDIFAEKNKIYTANGSEIHY